MGTLAGILKINPFGERRCLGYSTWHRRPCSTRIESDDLVGGLLRLGSWRLGQGDSIERELWQLAELVLCRRHRGLVRDFVTKWTTEVCRYQERERERERERHGQIQIQSQAESPRGLPPPTDTGPSSLPPATTTTTFPYSAASEFCLQPIQSLPSLQFDPDSFSISAMSASPNGDINPFHSIPSSIYIHSSTTAPVSIESPLPGQSLANPPVRATTKLVHSEPTSRYAATRRPIDGECGICTLPFSTDPDDGSFVDCIPMDFDVDDEGIGSFGSDEIDDESDETSETDVELGDADDECDDDDDDDEGKGEAAEYDTEEEPREGEKHDTDDSNNIVWCKVRCGTNYHRSCMNTWIRSFKNEAFRRPTCPTCRAHWKM